MSNQPNDKIDSVKERSVFVQEILGKLPPTILRWGIYFFFVFLLIIIYLSYLIKYPDIVLANIIITTPEPSIHIISPTSGRLQSLFVKDKDTVQAEQPLALIENAASLKDIFTLEHYLTALSKMESYRQTLDIIPPTGLKLGSVQTQYEELNLGIMEEKFQLKEMGFHEKINSMNSQITYLEKLNLSLERQENILQEENVLAKSNYDRNKHLFENRVISTADFETVEAGYLRQSRALEDMTSQILNNRIRIEQMKNQIIELKYQRDQNVTRGFITIKEKIQTVLNSIEEWKHRFLIRASIRGKISLSRIWSSNQFIQQNEELLVIIPLVSHETIGKLLMPEQNSGKVQIGQRVIIKLDSYNYREYGVVNGIVSSISLTPKNKTYTVDVSFPEDLITTYGKTILVSQEAQGIAEIVTEDLSLIERIFYNVKSIFVNG